MKKSTIFLNTLMLSVSLVSQLSFAVDNNDIRAQLQEKHLGVASYLSHTYESLGPSSKTFVTP